MTTTTAVPRPNLEGLSEDEQLQKLREWKDAQAAAWSAQIAAHPITTSAQTPTPSPRPSTIAQVVKASTGYGFPFDRADHAAPPSLDEIRREPNRPESPPEPGSPDYAFQLARWRSEVPTTYGFPLGRVEALQEAKPSAQTLPRDPYALMVTYSIPRPQDRRPVHNPFGFNPDAPRLSRMFHHPDSPGMKRDSQSRELWELAHASAVSKVSGATGGAALLADWERAVDECEERDKEAKRRAAAEEKARKRAEAIEGLPSYLANEHGLPVDPLATAKAGPKSTPGLDYARRCLAELDTLHGERVAPLLLLMGGTGAGKTTGAVVALVERCRAILQADDGSDPLARGYALLPSVEFWSATEMCRMGLYRQRNEDGSYGVDPAAIIKRAKECDVLILDDLGAEFLTENGPWQATLDEVIDARYRDRMVTILTTNLGWEVFSKRYGARIADRIAQKGRRVNAGNTSMRQPPPKLSDAPTSGK